MAVIFQLPVLAYDKLIGKVKNITTMLTKSALSFSLISRLLPQIQGYSQEFNIFLNSHGTFGENQSLKIKQILG
jgi:hypothetical protein